MTIKQKQRFIYSFILEALKGHGWELEEPWFGENLINKSSKIRFSIFGGIILNAYIEAKEEEVRFSPSAWQNFWIRRTAQRLYCQLKTKELENYTDRQTEAIIKIIKP